MTVALYLSRHCNATSSKGRCRRAGQSRRRCSGFGRATRNQPPANPPLRRRERVQGRFFATDSGTAGESASSPVMRSHLLRGGLFAAVPAALCSRHDRNSHATLRLCEAAVLPARPSAHGTVFQSRRHLGVLKRSAAGRYEARTQCRRGGGFRILACTRSRGR